MSGDLERLIYSCISRYLGGGTGHVGGNHYYERHGIVTSYDPQKYLAKVTYMPEGQESGWLPIETGHIGNDYGVAIGLQPGDGKKTGDQVIVRYQEGDLESGKIVQRVHSDNEKPPTVQSGEIVLWSKFKKSRNKTELGDETTDTGGTAGDYEPEGAQGGSGQQIYLKNDGSITWTDGNGGTFLFDGKGNATLTCNDLTFKVNGKWISDIAQVLTMIAQGDAGIKSSSNIEVKAGGTAGIDGGAKVVVQGGGDVSDGSVTPAGDQPPLPAFEVLP